MAGVLLERCGDGVGGITWTSYAKEAPAAPRKNPRILEILRLRPCFPAPLRMTMLEDGARAPINAATLQVSYKIFAGKQQIDDV